MERFCNSVYNSLYFLEPKGLRNLHKTPSCSLTQLSPIVEVKKLCSWSLWKQMFKLLDAWGVWKSSSQRWEVHQGPIGWNTILIKRSLCRFIIVRSKHSRPMSSGFVNKQTNKLQTSTNPNKQKTDPSHEPKRPIFLKLPSIETI